MILFELIKVAKNGGKFPNSNGIITIKGAEIKETVETVNAQINQQKREHLLDNWFLALDLEFEAPFVPLSNRSGRPLYECSLVAPVTTVVFSAQLSSPKSILAL